MNILLLDIEASPNIATVWGLFKQNIAINQILGAGEIICWAAKWYGSDRAFFDSIHRSSKQEMLEGIHKKIDAADAVVHYNGTRFDIPTLNRDFVLANLLPPSPYKHIDLLNTVKYQFRFVSNKMDFVCQQLGIDGKIKHPGHELWLKCMNGDDEAWKIMEQYNVHDVEMLEQLYVRLMPWIKGHANHSTFVDDHVCPNCGGHNMQRRGTAMAQAVIYQRFQCQDCGAWSRGRKSEPRAKNLLSPIA